MTDVATLDRLETLIRRMEALGYAAPASLAGADLTAFGPPAYVASGELIESAWGNAVVDAIGQRVGVAAIQSGQSVGAGQVVALAWSAITEQVPAASWGNSPFVVPAGCAGRYSGAVAIAGPLTPAGTAGDVVITAGGQQFTGYVASGKGNGTASFHISLSVGASIQVQVYNPTAGAAFYSASFTMSRVTF